MPVTSAHWHVLGAGAIGCLFASALHRAGCPVTLLLRDSHPGGPVTVQVEEEDGATATRTTLPASRTAEPGSITHLLVTTKAPDVAAAVLAVRHRLDERSQILLLANGMGFAEQLETALPAPRYFQGTTTAGAYRIGDRHVRHAGRGETRIGRAGDTVPPPWFEAWAAAVRPCVWDREIRQALWRKLAINCAINPLTAVHGCRNGALAEDRYRGELRALCREIMQVCAAAGFAGVTRELPEQVAAVIRDTAANRSSMLQDVLAGRATEIDYITGYLLQTAHRLAIAAPLNEALYRQVVALGR